MMNAPETQKNLRHTLSFAGEAVLEFDGLALRLDCSQPHERRYLVREFFGLPYPHVDIDSFFLRLLVRPGDVCLDAGANTGMTAIEMLRLGAHQIMAFEPVLDLAARLRRISDSRLKVNEVALGKSAGSADMLLSATYNQGHTLENEMTLRFPEGFGMKSARLPVRMDSLDDLARGRRANLPRSGLEGQCGRCRAGSEPGSRQNAATVPARRHFCET